MVFQKKYNWPNKWRPRKGRTKWSMKWGLSLWPKKTASIWFRALSLSTPVMISFRPKENFYDAIDRLLHGQGLVKGIIKVIKLKEQHRFWFLETQRSGWYDFLSFLHFTSNLVFTNLLYDKNHFHHFYLKIFWAKFYNLGGIHGRCEI